MNTTIPTAPPPAFERTVCPACGYSLIGLPPAGRCPECGGAYDSSEAVLYGWGCGRRASAWNARGGRLAFELFAPLVVPWLVLLGTGGGSHRLTYTLVTAGISALSVALVFTRRRGDDLPAPLQVRLGSRGCFQADVATPSGLRTRADDAFWIETSWAIVADWEWRPTAGDRHRIRVWPRVAAWGISVPVVNAEVRCAAPDVPRVRAALQQWTGKPPRR